MCNIQTQIGNLFLLLSYWNCLIIIVMFVIIIITAIKKQSDFIFSSEVVKLAEVDIGH